MQTDENGNAIGLSGDGIASECYTQNFYRITDELNIDPIDYSIGYPYPNPFDATTTINYSLPQDTHTKILIVNQQNIILETIFDANLAYGYHAVTINLSRKNRSRLEQERIVSDLIINLLAESFSIDLRMNLDLYDDEKLIINN